MQVPKIPQLFKQKLSIRARSFCDEICHFDGDVFCLFDPFGAPFSRSRTLPCNRKNSFAKSFSRRQPPTITRAKYSSFSSSLLVNSRRCRTPFLLPPELVEKEEPDSPPLRPRFDLQRHHSGPLA